MPSARYFPLPNRATSADRVVDLKNLYHRQLRKIAAFVRSFELRDKNDRVVYYLFFASNNATGHYKMKEAMWRVDPLGDFSFSDATNPDQTILFVNSPVEILKTDLIHQFRHAGEIPISLVESYVSRSTGFLRKHMGEVLATLESEGLIRVHPMKTNGKSRIAKTYPNEAVINLFDDCLRRVQLQAAAPRRVLCRVPAPSRGDARCKFLWRLSSSMLRAFFSNRIFL